MPDGWLMGLHQSFIPDGRRLEWGASIYVQRQPSCSIYLPYIPYKAAQGPEIDLCNKRFIVNLVLFVGVHQLLLTGLQKADISLGCCVGNIIGIKSDVYALPQTPFLMKRPTFRCLQLNLYICTLKAIGLKPFRNN